MSEIERLKQVACDAIDKASEDLQDLSEDIWNHPELQFEERHAHKILTEFLEKYGFQVILNHIIAERFC